MKAAAQAEVEQRTARAEASKIEVVKKAEAEKGRTVLEAEARKQTMALEGEGEKLQKMAAAEGVQAVGTAEAKVEFMKREAKYGGEAGQRRAVVEIATAQAEKLANILKDVKVIPEKAFISLYQDGGQTPITLDESVVKDND